MPDSDPTQLPANVPEEAVDSLYGLPLDEFTPNRDRLAKHLRGDGQRAAADWVKGLRKPTAAAWTVNQLARTQTKDAKRLLDSADALRAAQERVFAGDASPHQLAEATEEAAAASRELVAKAPGLLDRQGRSPRDATLDKVAETLRAIALDDEARAGFAAGRLTRERQASGFGLGAPQAPAGARKAPATAKAKAKAMSRPDAKQIERARAALEKARSRHETQTQRVAELARALRDAEREAQTAKRRADQATAELERARAKQKETQARLAEAEGALEDLG